ncbi:hypothetical protein BJX99DRAFT_247987 [Aspergillus californicus]
MNGKIAEATTRRVEWPDVDEDTFTRLCEYAYMGDYTPPPPREVVDEFIDYYVDDFMKTGDQPERLTSPRQDLTPVFLGHAQLYILADKYEIQPLCQLALSKLFDTLRKCTPYRASVFGVVEFAPFAYSAEYADSVKIEPLQRLAVSYTVSIIRYVGYTTAFLDLLAEGGRFVSDFGEISIYSFNDGH